MGGWRSRLCRTRLLAAPAFRANVCVARKSKFCSDGLGGRDYRRLQKPFSHHSRRSPKTHCVFLSLKESHAITLIEIKPHRWAGKFLKRPESNLCSRRNVRPSITPKIAHVFAPARFAFSIRAVMSNTPFRNETERKL